MERRYIDANALQVRLERKKAGIANQRYTEGWNDCMMRVKSMVSKSSTINVHQWCTGIGFDHIGRTVIIAVTVQNVAERRCTKIIDGIKMVSILFVPTVARQ